MKAILNVIYKLLVITDKIIDKFFKKSFLYYFKDLFEKDLYIEKKILNKKVSFYIPNKVTKWRVGTFYEKEPETLEWIDTFNDSNKIIFWDIGANIGLYSIYAALKHKNIEIISFEPSTNNLRILSRNISINNLEGKIKINQFPLSDKTNEFASMNESEFIEGWSMGTFAYQNDFEGKHFVPKQKYKILGTSINYLLDSKILNVPNFIKIDVDGIEHMILKGADKYLDNKNIKSMLIELNENFKDQFDSVLRIMSDKKFKIKFKKRSDDFYMDNSINEKENKFSKVFNYIFER
tara:strand:+ start:753 stop:1631 length:879 start_codon:yes stop_codon:yes gene_type:complete